MPVDGADARHVGALQEWLDRLHVVERHGSQAAGPVQHLDQQPLGLQHQGVEPEGGALEAC